MKVLLGKPHNIDSELLGIITTKSISIFSRSKYIFVSKSKSCSGYLANIVTAESYNGKDAVVTVENFDSFNDGDVVLITPEGQISFLYEICASHNALFVTERCNHRCIMCPQPPKAREEDKTSFNLKLINLIDKSTRELGITGGEPTLIGDNLFVLLNAIQKKLPNTAVSILSNGVKFANKEFAKKLSLSFNGDLQIDIPLFSDIASEHNAIVGANTFYKTVEGLYNLALFRQRIGIRVVIHQKTYRRLVHLADFIYHNFPFVSQVAFMQMETTGLAKSNIEDLWIDPYDYNKELREAMLLLWDRGIPAYIYNSQLCILPDDIRQYAVQSISEWKDIYLDDCAGCSLRGQCAGFFESNKNYHSAHIHKIIDNSDNSEDSVSISINPFV